MKLYSTYRETAKQTQTMIRMKETMMLLLILLCVSCTEADDRAMSMDTEVKPVEKWPWE